MKNHTENPTVLAHELIQSGLVSGILSSPRSPAGITQDNRRVERIRIHPVQLKNGASFQLEEFSGTQTFHRNVTKDELETLLGNWLHTDFSRAEFTGTDYRFQVLSNRHGEITVIRRPIANGPESTSGTKEKVHNRTKNYILREGTPVPFLVDLGIMTPEGTVIRSMYDKFRQINRFLEFIADVVPELKKAAAEHADEIRIVDFGCGKSYLTFAVYYFLSDILSLTVRITGLDLKETVIRHCNELAKKYEYDRLDFAVGNIADFSAIDSDGREIPPDMVISLHACDTATDYALAQAIRWETRIIMAVPCCQHELNAQLAQNSGANDTKSDACGRAILSPVFRYGIIRERMAALFTDALRAELLEMSGYRVQVLEFVDMSHTPKNLLIRAVRGSEKKSDAEYRQLCDFLSVRPTLEGVIDGKDSGRDERRSGQFCCGKTTG